MGKKRRAEKRAEVRIDVIIAALQDRAEDHATSLGHRMGSWQSAKWRWGKAAKISWCPECCGQAVVLPYGNKMAKQEVLKTTPSIVGDVLFERCEKWEK